MRAFRLKLVEQLLEAPGALSRNRHFDTFADADGKSALRLSRYLRALERDILAQHERGEAIAMEAAERHGEPAVRIELTRPRGKQLAYLSRDELQLLLQRPGVREALGL